MNIDLSGTTAIATGSTGGIGFAIARGLAGSGASVVVNGRTQAKADAAAEAIIKAVPGAKARGVGAEGLDDLAGVLELGVAHRHAALAQRRRVVAHRRQDEGGPLLVRGDVARLVAHFRHQHHVAPLVEVATEDGEARVELVAEDEPERPRRAHGRTCRRGPDGTLGSRRPPLRDVTLPRGEGEVVGTVAGMHVAIGAQNRTV